MCSLHASPFATAETVTENHNQPKRRIVEPSHNDTSTKHAHTEGRSDISFLC